MADELCGVQADGGGGAVDKDVEWFFRVQSGGRSDWGRWGKGERCCKA